MRILSPKIVLLFLIALAAVCSTMGQNNPPPDGVKPPNDGRMQRDRPNPLRMLGLTQDQTQQIRRMNQARKPEMDRAALRLRLANRALDEAIYADTVDEALFQTCLKELQSAQADMARLRFTGELGIRKILTPEQLARFRDIRRQLAPQPSQGQREPVGVDDKNPVPMRVFTRVP